MTHLSFLPRPHVALGANPKDISDLFRRDCAMTCARLWPGAASG